MSLSKAELIKKLEAISILHNKVLAIKDKMDRFAPDDNYERTVIVPRFPGEFHDEEVRRILRDKVDHTSSDAIEFVSNGYDKVYHPKKPAEPNKPKFSSPSTFDEENRESKLGCLSYFAIGVSIFFLLGAFFSVEKGDPVRQKIFLIAAIAAAVFIILRFFILLTVGSKKRKLARAKAAYDSEIKKIDSRYKDLLKTYEKNCESHISKRKVFLSQYIEWRKVYLKHVKEETEINDKLEEIRLAEVARIEAEELAPVLQELTEINDIVSADYLPAIDVIIELIKSGRADDVKEAINLYEEILYRERQLQLEREKEEQRQREEQLRREDEERRHREQMEFQEEQEYARQREEERRRETEERHHQEEMRQRERMESARRGQEYNDCIKQCNSCAYYSDCKVKFQRPNCSSFRPR